jgi:hypothetical protein
MRFFLITCSLILWVAAPAQAASKSTQDDKRPQSVGNKTLRVGDKMMNALMGTLGAGNKEVNDLLQKRARRSDLLQKEKQLLEDFDADQKQLMFYRKEIWPICYMNDKYGQSKGLNVAKCEDLSAKDFTEEERKKPRYLESLTEVNVHETFEQEAKYLFTNPYAIRMQYAEESDKLFRKWNVPDQQASGDRVGPYTLKGKEAENQKVDFRRQAAFTNNFTLLNAPHLEQLAKKLTEGKSLTDLELQTLEDARKDQATMQELVNKRKPVCQISQTNDKKNPSHIGFMPLPDCATFSPEELAKTHVVSLTINTSMGTGPTGSFRYQGSDEEERIHQATINQIKQKWENWESQQ